MNHLNGENSEKSLPNKKDGENIETAVYKIRWLMLSVVVLLNISNGSLWISFATIANKTADYFNVSNAAVNWFALVFFVTTIPMMFVALFVTARYGFKASVWIGGGLNALGSVIRLVSTIPGIPGDSRYPIAITGQIIASLAQPFVIVLHTKVSQVWFSEKQRIIATALAAMSNPFGFMVASVVSPIVVRDSSDVPLTVFSLQLKGGCDFCPSLNYFLCQFQNYILSGLGIVAGFYSFVVRNSKPPKPPSIAASSDKTTNAQAFIKDLLYIFRNKDFMILTLAIGGGMGLITTLEAMMSQIICPNGYNNKAAGLCCATMVLGGYIGAGIYSYFTKERKNMEEIIKLGYTFSVVASIVLTMVMQVRDVTWALATLCGLLGFLSMGIYPICLEAGVETSYPLDVSFSSGMIVVSGQIQGTIFIPVMEALARPLDYEDQFYQVCSSGSADEAYDMTYSGIFLTSYAAILNVIVILFFRPKYNRLAIERRTNTTTSTKTHELAL